MRFLGEILDLALEVVAPTRCAGCDMPGALLCERCRAALSLIAPIGACPSCGAPYGHIVCTECWSREYEFSATTATCSLERPMSRMITLYKDGAERRLAHVLAQELSAAIEGSGWGSWPSALVPIPATPAAIRRRGFDHVELLVSSAAAILDLPVCSVLVSSGARDLRRLGRAERLTAVERAFCLADSAVPPRALVVDDVFTTGSTLNAAAGVLLAGGAQEVRAAVLARAW